MFIIRFFIRFNFRKLTDKPKDEVPAVVWSESVENVEELGKGNNSLLPSFDSGTTSQLNKIATKPTPNVESTKIEIPPVDKADEYSDGTAESHMITYKGALIDVGKLLQQLNRSEKAREETEIRLTELTKTQNELQSSNSKAKDKIKDLQSELKSYNRKVSDAESSLSSANVRRTHPFYYHIYFSNVKASHSTVPRLFTEKMQ